MAKKITVIVQSEGTQVERDITVGDDFDLKESYYDYLTGIKVGPHGNTVLGAMIGDKYYVRFSDAIEVFEAEQ
ncbi:hypothetical protein IGI37_002250 [Enterococcus sp. AZ194]|uniref:hypothetical protein n=1 Tax=Enterococcus sp. AZ194 TaxID=2774629 RepID=UPI003F282160